MNVTQLGYIGLDVSDLDQWKTFSRAIIGLEIVDRDGSDQSRFAWMAIHSGSFCTACRG